MLFEIKKLDTEKNFSLKIVLETDFSDPVGPYEITTKTGGQKVYQCQTETNKDGLKLGSIFQTKFKAGLN